MTNAASPNTTNGKSLRERIQQLRSTPTPPPVATAPVAPPSVTPTPQPPTVQAATPSSLRERLEKLHATPAVPPVAPQAAPTTPRVTPASPQAAPARSAITGVSTGYRAASVAEIRDEHRRAWQDTSIPAKQRALVQTELAAMYRGAPPRVYTSLAEALAPWLRRGERLLEVGCASGYYYEALEYLMKLRIDYTGVDYSEALVAMAREFYPRPTFLVADGGALPFEDGAFDVVVSGSVLLHVEDWRGQIREAVRVASRAVALHRTPVRRTGPTMTFIKRAYGVETFEHLFSEEEVLTVARAEGLVLRSATTLDHAPERESATVTYVFEKRSGEATPRRAAAMRGGEA